MAYQPYYITEFEQNSGLEKYFESFLLPEKAFPTLVDAYCWRGRIRKRRGFYELGRLRRSYVYFVGGVLQPSYPLPVTGAGNYTTADVLAGVRATEPYAELYPNSVVITIARGLANQTTYQDDGNGNMVLTFGTITITSGTINYVTGALNLVFTAAPGAGLTVDINTSYYPALPVMGLETEELSAIYQEKLVAFDEKYAYEYNYTFDEFVELAYSAPKTWTGGDADFFWTTNYWYNANGNILWTTNFHFAAGVGGDPIRWYTDPGGWTDFTPALGGGSFLQQAECILPFKGRLLMFNTWEGAIPAAAINAANRVRWSWVGDPTDQVNGWLTGPGAGGFLDASTDEHIVSVEPLKDVILVKFERSSWKLIYTGNQTQPFIFQRINMTFGAQATNSLVPFDDGVFAVARNAITTDDTTSVERIDLKIPDEVFNMVNLSPQNLPPPLHPGNRIYGIRDYINELVFWSFLDLSLFESPTSSIFPNRVLVLNYRNNSYAIFNDSFTCFGYFQSLKAYDDTIHQNVPYIVGGNQQGFVEVLTTQLMNSPSLAITAIAPGNPAIFTVPNHNFSSTTQYYVRLDGIMGTAPHSPSTFNYVTTPAVYLVHSIDANTFSLFKYNPATDNFDILQTLAAGGTYIGGGTVTVVQNYNILTKTFCPTYEQGSKQRLPYIDFLFDRTLNGQTTCYFYQNEITVRAINSPTSNPQGLLGSASLLTSPENLLLIPEQNDQTKIWHRFYIQAVAQNFQIQLTMNNYQLANQYDSNGALNPIAATDFVLHAMTLYLSPTARLIQ